ncbi:MAG: transglycosylase SLT domain-containing protein [Thermoanaerobaculia bacterium]|nr:transglycosylase SLT domain-containing protein [Thermoanaerobaculia bacterium]
MPVTLFRRAAWTLALCGALVAAEEFFVAPAAEATAPVAAPAASLAPAALEPPTSSFAPGQPPAAEYAAAAAAARSGGFPAASQALAAQLAGGEPGASRARVVLGLMAWESGRGEDSRRLLARGPGPLALEDLRLHALAEESTARGARTAARQALEELLRSTPESPLRQTSLLELAELAWAEGRASDALAFIERGRREALSAPECERIDSLAWTIGRATGDETVLREAARRLLVRSPLAAARLDVAGVLVTRPNGDWRAFLSAEDLLARAVALLLVEVPQGALSTLDAVPQAARTIEWSLLRARALTAAQRGSEAFAELALARPAVGDGPADGDQLAELELERAHAVAEAAAVRRGRPPLPAADRARLRADGLQALRRAVAAATSAELKATALRELYAEVESTGDFDAAIALLHDLAKVAPGDALGARPLWERGWREYQAGNWSGAIGLWSELRDLYPKASYSRSAYYWTGRAFEKLGDRERSRAAFVELADADTADFYSRQSVLRLSKAPSAALRERDSAREDWPSDRAVERARWLSDLALDKHASAELDRVAAAADARAVAALRGLVLARTGARRESLRELRKAFPQLATAHQETVPRAALELFYPRAFAGEVARFAGEKALPASLVFGIVHQESGFDPAAKSRSGARGLMQIMPSTGKELARRLGMPFSTQRLFEPEYSLRLGTTYFRQMLGIFDNRVELALAGYNGGPGRIGRLWREQQSAGEVDRFLEGLTIVESRNYVKRILVLAESYRSLYSDLS